MTSSSFTSNNSGQSSTFPSIATTFSSSSVEDESKPLCQYVTKNQRLTQGGENISWQCNFCHCSKNSSYTRVRAHLLDLGGHGIGLCSKNTPQDKASMHYHIYYYLYIYSVHVCVSNVPCPTFPDKDMSSCHVVSYVHAA